MWKTYLQPASIDETLVYLGRNNADARIINGGTDLILELEQKVRKPEVIIDISRVPGLDGIRQANGWVH